MKKTLSLCLAVILTAGIITSPVSNNYNSEGLASAVITASANGTYCDEFIEGGKYRIRSMVGKYYVGTYKNKTSGTTNVELVNKKDASSVWTAHYSSKYDAWYFTLGNTNMALNCFADKGKVKNKTNVNLYKLSKNDPTQTFTLCPYSDGSYNLVCSDNNDVCLEVSGYASNAAKGTNVRLYKHSDDITQRWFLDPV